MMTVGFITALFYEIDEQLALSPNTPRPTSGPVRSLPWGCSMPSKAGATGVYRWLTRDYRTLFPRLPERTRLFRLFVTHHDWTQAFLAAPTVLGVIDAYGIELIPSHARRPQSPADRPERPLESSLDCRWEAVSLIESVGVDRRVGVCHRERR